MEWRENVCMENSGGVGFCALYCLESEVSADHPSDLRDILKCFSFPSWNSALQGAHMQCLRYLNMLAPAKFHSCFQM